MPFTLTNAAERSKFHLLLAHGAGAGITSPFFRAIVPLLLERHISVTLFEFHYMSELRTLGRRRPAPRAETLVSEYDDIIRSVSKNLSPGQRLVIGGKSLGGRVATLVADRMHNEGLISGVVCLGYPFHPPQKPTQLRTAHLDTLCTPTLILQGERDAFGDLKEVEAYTLSSAISVAWLGDGDHDLKPRRSSGHSTYSNLIAAADKVAAFLASLPPRR